jgi:hypothetical protein
MKSSTASPARAKDRPKPAEPERDDRPGGGAGGHGYRLGDRKLTDEAVIAALRRTRGIKSEAARLLKVAPSTVFAYLAERPHLKERLREIDEEALDEAEGQLWAGIERGEMRAVTFFLSTRGKHRGYTTRVEQTGADREPILHEIAPPSVDEMMAVLDRLAEER